jgi:hypothetical protein
MSAPSDYPPGPAQPSPPTNGSSADAAPDGETLKRGYLSLLTKDQIISICLLLDKHVSADIQSTIWPVDLGASSETTSTSPTVTASTLVPKEEVLLEPATQPGGPPAQTPMDASLQQASVPSLAVKSASPYPELQPSLSSVLPYQHAPFGFNAHHTPYYTSSGTVGTTSYGSGSTSSTYPYPHQHPQPAVAVSNGGAGADLPSYEDMIVEGLQELGATDPEGAAPKTLFNWMGARWPLQINFRPSASQALQKAFKRGRLEKSQSGKYRLNPAWGGGSVRGSVLNGCSNTSELEAHRHHDVRREGLKLNHRQRPPVRQSNRPPRPLLVRRFNILRQAKVIFLLRLGPFRMVHKLNSPHTLRHLTLPLRRRPTCLMT